MKSTFGLYLHIPYCIRKCPYCDFNSYGVNPASETSMPEERYVNALLGELRAAMQSERWKGRTCHSIFFGGGTPSLFSPASYRKLLGEIRAYTTVLGTTEITMETNPGTVFEALDRERLEGIREAGVNRISLGVQSFSERKRKLLGRWHSTEEILRAVENVRAAGFSNFSFDFIFGVDEENCDEWEADLKQAISLGPHHISAYGLTIEPGTEFGRQKKRGTLRELDEDVQAELYTQTKDRLSASGYQRYEISNYALPGSECRHNLGYWSGEDYLGLGAGAHSYFRDNDGTSRWINIPGPEDYMNRITAGGSAIQRTEQLNIEQQEIEFFFLRLRTAQGFRWEEHATSFPLSPKSQFVAPLKELEAENLLVMDEHFVRLSDRGFLFSDTVFSTLARSVGE